MKSDLEIAGEVRVDKEAIKVTKSRVVGGPSGSRLKRVVEVAGTWAVFGGYALMVVVFSIARPSIFLSWSNLQNILDMSVVPILLVGGITLVLVIGEFDLSFTAAAGLTAAVAIVLMAHHGVNPIIASVIGIAAAALVSVAVSSIVTYGKVSSFIASLAVGSAATGIEQGLTGNQTIYSGVPNGYSNFTMHSLAGIHLPVFFAAFVVVILHILLRKTPLGRHAQAVGSNLEAARLAGISAARMRLVAFLITGVLAGVAAIVLTSRAGSYFPDAATGYLLSTYAAAFLGSAAQGGRRFSIGGSVIGVLWLVTLQAGLTDLNEASWIANLVEGLVLVAAVVFAVRGRRQ